MIAYTFVLLLLIAAPQTQRVPAAQFPANPSPANVAPALEVRVHDVADLAEESWALAEAPAHDGPVRDRPSLDRSALDGPASDAKFAPNVLRRSHAADHRALARVVTHELRPALAEHPGSAVRATDGGALVVTGTPAQQAWVERFLTFQRAHAGALVRIDCRIARLGPAARAGLPASVPEPDVFASVPLVMDDAAAVDDLLRHLENASDVDLEMAPQAVAFNRQRVGLSALESTPYVADYALYESVAPGGASLVDPIVREVEEGVRLGARATLLEGEAAFLELELELLDLVAMPTHATEYGTVALPSVERVELQTTLTLRDGATAVFVAPEQGEELVLLLVRVRAVHAERAAPPPPGAQRR